MRVAGAAAAFAVIVVIAMVPITWIMMAPLLGWSDEPGVQRHEARCLENPSAPACVDEGASAPAEVIL